MLYARIGATHKKIFSIEYCITDHKTGLDLGFFEKSTSDCKSQTAGSERRRWPAADWRWSGSGPARLEARPRCGEAWPGGGGPARCWRGATRSGAWRSGLEAAGLRGDGRRPAHAAGGRPTGAERRPEAVGRWAVGRRGEGGRPAGNLRRCGDLAPWAGGGTAMRSWAGRSMRSKQTSGGVWREGAAERPGCEALRLALAR